MTMVIRSTLPDTAVDSDLSKSGSGTPNDRALSTGLQSLCIVAAVHQITADAIQLTQALGLDGVQVGPNEILLAAKEIGLSAKARAVAWERLPKLTLPAILELEDSEYAVLLRVDKAHALIRDPRQPRPQLIPKEELQTRYSGKLVLIKTRLRADNPNRPFDLKWFVPVVWRYRNVIGEVLAASFVIQLFALTTPLFTQIIIDKVLVHKSVPTLDVVAVGMLIIIVFEGVLNMLQTHLMAHTANRVDVILGGRVVKHLLRISLRYFEMRRVGNTVAHVRELETIRQFITGNAITSVLDLLFIGLFITVMFFYSIPLTAVVLLSIPFFVGLSLLIRPLMRERLEERFDRGAESQSYLVEIVTGIQTVKAMALEPIMYRRWETLLARYVTSSFRATHLSGIASAIGQVIQRGANLAILWVGADLVMKGDMTVGQLIAFQMLSGRVISPILRVVRLWQDFQQIGISVERLGDIMNAKPEPIMTPGKTALPPLTGAIRMESVRFRYQTDGPEILRNFSIDIASGTTVGVVGRSGSGKSTLAKLLQRLYLPESGRILVDGVDLQQADPMWLRRQIGVVLQENFLFSGSIRENIGLHMPGVPMAHIIEVARLAGAHEFILELPNGYDTQAGERGTALSGGQRQRVAIARALLANPRILIFDEATSALDYESERIIQRNLARICQGRTVFIIAHRLSTIRHANTILVLDRGELKEQGTHNDLLARQGIYHHLFSQQEPPPHVEIQVA